jgi:para-aminobenzoate synthetase/4-amino-4-deoxychorismate lyase
VVARPGPAGEAVVEVERIAVDSAALFPMRPLELRALVLPGGLGSHKWADRSLVASAPEPLLVDLGGDLLESGSGNLFVVDGDRLVTPPADGRILPGVTRDAVVRLAPELGLEVSIETVSAARAGGADELFVTSAVRGLQPVGRCAGIGEWPVGQTARSLGDRLRREWAAHAPSEALR